MDGADTVVPVIPAPSHTSCQEAPAWSVYFDEVSLFLGGHGCMPSSSKIWGRTVWRAELKVDAVTNLDRIRILYRVSPFDLSMNLCQSFVSSRHFAFCR